MNNDILYRIALLLVLAAFVVNRAYYTKKYGRPEADTVRGREESAVQVAANGLNLLALMATAIYLVAPGWLDWAALPFPAWLRWAGLGLALAGFGLLSWAQATLSRNWSDRPRLLADQTLVTDGPYRRVRHPIYTAFLLILSAPLFLSANWLVGLSWITATALEVAARVRYEEALLAEEFGADYRAYAAHTGRLLPRILHSTNG
jgi:protein-S-isoprenylcysteine O-methyltransferase Ste14